MMVKWPFTKMVVSAWPTQQKRGMKFGHGWLNHHGRWKFGCCFLLFRPFHRWISTRWDFEVKRAPSTHGTQTGSLALPLGFSNCFFSFWGGVGGKDVQGNDLGGCFLRVCVFYYWHNWCDMNIIWCIIICVCVWLFLWWYIWYAYVNSVKPCFF